MENQSISIIGGSGALGGGLAMRWAAAGYRVVVGSRRAEAASEAAATIYSSLADRKIACSVDGMDNAKAAEVGNIVVLAVPFAQQRDLLEHIRPGLTGKILVDTTVPLMPPKVGTVQLPEGSSAAVLTQRFLGSEVRVVSAFQNVAADKLRSLDVLECDVLVCGDDLAARNTVIGLAAAAGMRAFHAGPLANSAAAEALTSVLITINRQHKCQAGIRIVGLSGS